jgi:hypothetical protein
MLSQSSGPLYRMNIHAVRDVSYIARHTSRLTVPPERDVAGLDRSGEATYKIISSTALPNVTFSNAPVASPNLRATLSVA